MATKSPKAHKAATKARKTSKASKASDRAKAPAMAAQGRDRWGFRQGTKASKAAALYGAAGGATRAEIVKACGSPQMNLLDALAEKGHKVTQKPRVCKVTGTEVIAYHIARPSTHWIN
jgi:hypothetical protein